MSPPSVTPPSATTPPGLRVMTWNVHELSGGSAQVADVVRDSGADVVCLQEVPRLLLSMRRLRALADRCGLVAVAGGHRGAGTAVLLRPSLVVTSGECRRLPVRRPFSPEALRGRPIRPLTRPRGFALARVDVPGLGLVTVISVHLGLDPRERARHVDQLLHVVAAAPGPVVLAGDLNEEPGDPSWQRLCPPLVDANPGGAPTFPAHRPRRRLDAVLISPDVPLTSFSGTSNTLRLNASSAVSDHLPVVVTTTGPTSSVGVLD